MNKSSNFSSLLSFVVIVMIVGVVLGYLFVFTDNFSTDVKTFYIKCNNNTYMSNASDFEVLVDQEYKFEVVDTLGINNNLEVSVVPNNSISASSFEFYVNGVYHQFSFEDDLTAGFDIKTYDTYFTFKATKDLKDILSSNYPGRSITGCPSAFYDNIQYFQLVVSNQNGSEKISINFYIYGPDYYSLTLIPRDNSSTDSRGHISFSQSSVKLTYTKRQASFNYIIDDGYDFYDCLFDGYFSVVCNNGTCVITLNDDYILLTNEECYLNFSIGT